MKKNKISRREYFKLNALAAVGGLALTGCGLFRSPSSGDDESKNDPDQKNTLFQSLPTCKPGEKLGKNEMRITFWAPRACRGFHSRATAFTLK